MVIYSTPTISGIRLPSAAGVVAPAVHVRMPWLGVDGFATDNRIRVSACRCRRRR